MHEHWRTELGLPQNSIFCFAQDRDGFLWFGTESGLVRFDGFEFRVFSQHPPTTSQNEFISSLLAARDGTIWAGTRTGGLVRFRDEKFETPFPEFSEERVFSLAESNDGTIWVGTAHNLKRIANGTVETIDTSAALPQQRITALCVTGDDSVWIGTSSGVLARYQNRKLQTFPNPLAVRQNTITALGEDPRTNTLWIASDGEGLFRFTNGSFTRVELTGRELEYVQALLVDEDGAVWTGTEQDGIIRYREGEASAFSAQDGLNTDSVLCLFRDREGSVWAGTLFGGLHRLHRGAFATFGRRQGLPTDSVTCVLEASPGTLWIGTRNQGLLKKTGQGFEPMSTPATLKDVRAMLRTREGEIWAGGKESVVNRFPAAGPATVLSTREGLVSNDATAFFETRSGQIWIGSQRNGISIFDPREEKVTQVLTNDFLQTYIRCFAEDSEAVWIGTQNGLVRYADGALERMDLGQFSHASIRAILPGTGRILWIGTRDDGLLRLGPEGVFHFKQSHGVAQTRIYQFLQTDHTLWIAGSRGIEAIKFAELEAVASGRQQRVKARHFTERDGLQTAECGGDSTPSAALASDGTIWFGTRRGLSWTRPTTDVPSAPAPKVVIEKVRIDNNVVSARGFTRVPPGATRVQFSYTAPALANRDRIQFCYKLEGVDKDWIEAGRERDAVYYHLRPGRYHLTVSAEDPGGRWSEQPTSMAFVVAPQFYQTAWFYALITLFGAGGVGGLYRWRVAGIQRRNKKLRELVQVRTRELEEEVAQRKQAQEDQIALNADLEGRVQERTSQLSHAYENLQAQLRERQRVEEELAASEARLRRVVDSGMVGILFWDDQGRILDANETFLQMVGYTRQELEGGDLYWSRITPPEYAERDAAALAEIANSGVCIPFEKEYLRKNGSRFPVLLGGASLANGPREGVCFVLDISERKASEEKVRSLAHSLEERVQERTRELARINEQLAGEVQERKRVAVALSAFSQLGQKLHGSRTETEAANIIALTAKSLIAHDICSIELYGSDHKLYPIVSEAQRYELSEPIRSSISVAIRNGTRVIGVIGLKSSTPDSFMPSDANTLQALGDYCGGALDRIHAEEARRETERRFVAFMTNAPALAWMKDAEFRYVFTNPMFQKFLGLPATGIDGRTDPDLWPEAIAARIRHNDQQVFARESTVETHETLRRADEESRTLLTFRFPFTTASGERFIAGMAIDISEQKRAEEALHRLPQAILEAQEQERRRLARELHDGVNQAIASAKFRIQTAENQILRGDQKWQESCSKSKEMLDSVLQQVRRLSHNLRPGELDDLGLLAAARTAFREFEDRTKIQVHFAVTGLEGRLDPALELTFYRLIQEALTNIERHSSATAVDIHLTQNTAGVSLEISDNGVGFDTTQPQVSRPGLGLLHMRERANLVGADFTIETAPGDGVRLLIHVSRKGLGNG